ncbi:hypothetical protein HPB52_013234 [Rhipicephalus sanguineus]|uniref:Uncharacterized protein n=1 Tax=Rhipicephalus sanguineus TaxID=34632 RepID=A0A9D4PZU0_RHISA|nr:hypothetical protein HPB52_013234 [Rhipicephalus sanguineus]
MGDHCFPIRTSLRGKRRRLHNEQVVDLGSADEATSPGDRPSHARGIEAEEDALQKTGETLETVGRLLQGENVALTDEGQEDLIKALRVASNFDEVLSEDGSEYIPPLPMIRRVTQGVIDHVVHKKRNKG